VTDYVLSRDADTDLLNIYWFTHERWGEAQAEAYIHGLFESFATIAQHPDIGRSRAELSPQIRSLVHKRHIIYYLKMDEGVGISRVLHVSMDVEHAGLFED
jgi:toxin ParE1/3/4